MKRFRIGLLVFASVFVVGCTPEPGLIEPSPYSLPPAVGAEVAQTELSDVYDDGFGSVIILLDDIVSSEGQVEEGIAQILAKKKAWVQKYPDRRVLCMSPFTAMGSFGSSSHAALYGVMLTYVVEE